VIGDVANGLCHLKAQTHVHGDIKESNIVWNAQTKVYVIIDLDLLNVSGTNVEEFIALSVFV